jgi:hypothetical protein
MKLCRQRRKQQLLLLLQQQQQQQLRWLRWSRFTRNFRRRFRRSLQRCPLQTLGFLTLRLATAMPAATLTRTR